MSPITKVVQIHYYCLFDAQPLIWQLTVVEDPNGTINQQYS
jgi:hypothetical protein